MPDQEDNPANESSPDAGPATSKAGQQGPSSIFEVSAIRDETRFQVWPFVSLGTGYSSEGFRISIENKGVGPAKIRDISFYFDGELMESRSMGELLNELVAITLGEEEKFDYGLYRMSDPEGGVMTADESTDLFSVPWDETTGRVRRLAGIWQERLLISVCYCSVYDDCWVAELNGGEPREVPTCPAP